MNSAAMSSSGRERRVFTRHTPAQVAGTAEVTLQGTSCRIVNISQTGTLVEHTRWMSMRAAVRVRVTVNSKGTIVQGRIVRSKVRHLTDHGVVYEVAISFDEPPALLHGLLSDRPTQLLAPNTYAGADVAQFAATA